MTSFIKIDKERVSKGAFVGAWGKEEVCGGGKRCGKGGERDKETKAKEEVEYCKRIVIIVKV